MSVEYHNGPITLVLADCREHLARLAAEPRFTAVVTDPPYELGFMQRKWDQSGVSFDPETWRTILAASLPGAPLLAFGGTRTFHRIFCAIEDGGWEVRDSLSWLRGQGIPKGHDISKAIDKAAGAEREVIGSKHVSRDYTRSGEKGDMAISHGPVHGCEVSVTAPATPEAKLWDGWNIALRPLWEPILLARSPLDGTVAANALKHGTGGLNIEGCRIGTETKYNPPVVSHWTDEGYTQRKSEGQVVQGRWPANVVLSHTEDCRPVGHRTRDGRTINRFTDGAKPFGGGAGHPYESEKMPDDVVQIWDCPEGCPVRMLDEQSGVSRFYYCSKASPRERRPFNTWPTVKPLKLMEWLCTLVRQPERNLILDPFCGSGTTLVACQTLGIQAVGIEKDAKAFEIAVRRLEGE